MLTAEKQLEANFLVLCHFDGKKIGKEMCHERTSLSRNNIRFCKMNNCDSPHRRCWACVEEGLNGQALHSASPNPGLCTFHRKYGPKKSHKAELQKDQQAALSEAHEKVKEIIKSIFVDKKPFKKVLMEVPVDLIDRNPEQPRQYFNEFDVANMAESLRTNGQEVEIRLRPQPDGRLLIEDGETRWLGAKANNDLLILSIILPPEDDKDRVFLKSFICNNGRTGHSHYDICKALGRIRRMKGFKELDEQEFVTKAAGMMGKKMSRKSVEDHYKVLGLPKPLFERLHPRTPEKERLLFSAAVALTQHKVPAGKRESLGLQIIEQGMTGTQAKLHIHKKVGGKQEVRRGRPSDDAALVDSFINGTRDRAKYFVELGIRRIEAIFNSGKYSREEMANLLNSSLDWQEQLLKMMGGKRNKNVKKK